MHLSFESLVVTNTPNLQAFLMDLHHDTFFRSILEDDSISSTFRARIRLCSSKGARLWLVVRLSICLFHIARFTFTSALCFRFTLIQPSISSFFTCDYGHELDASGTHLVHCMFGGQQIATHDIIRNIMYAFVRKSGHIVWRKRWYAFTSKVSL